MNRLLAVPLALGAAAALAAGALGQIYPPRLPEGSSATLDQGTFLVYQGAQLMGSEAFSLESNGDSMLVKSRSFQVVLGDTIRKDVAEVLGPDYGLHNYLSKLVHNGHTLSRSLLLGDTTVMSYRQYDLRGSGDQMVLPPGRVFVLDPKSFICFDLICRSFQGVDFDHRPVTLFVMGTRDTAIEATALNHGDDTLKWGAKRVVARKYSIGDERATFHVWALPSGAMVRLEEPVSGLRVERQPEAVRRAAVKPKPKPPGR